MRPDPDAGPGILSRGDVVARKLLARLEPLRFAEAATPQEREGAYRLRRQAVLDAGMESPEPFPGGLERDGYDAEAVQILGWEGPDPIATLRIVPPRSGRPLPFEETFGPVACGDGTAEWGRVAVASRLRGEGGRIFMGLAARGWLAMRSRGLSTAIGVTPRSLVALFRALGFPVTVLGDSRVHWGIERVPILCRGPAAVRALEQLWSMQEGTPSG